MLMIYLINYLTSFIRWGRVQIGLNWRVLMIVTDFTTSQVRKQE